MLGGAEDEEDGGERMTGYGGEEAEQINRISRLHSKAALVPTLCLSPPTTPLPWGAIGDLSAATVTVKVALHRLRRVPEET